MQLSSVLSVLLPLSIATLAVAQKSYCRAFVGNQGFSNAACRTIQDVCTTACPRECGAGFKLQSVNVEEGKCGCFCTKI
ncbi:hypothetical protein Cob_v007048 [Colletotrichum orbiculare MAFF 240422]|uniref:Uncharacterized protein n=1 Tax=Colletotrichum orbiculare (strain 104-T / ATCC 96160 / CBS 514.97 / LARS 414 / MAFF 240422) TaxID=1213857 RepID=A0A484FT16_COLOR|nr:hypothetical protein Cob_v007048 [Colletotrichum orbiculare MAFF 240422]